jgi:hypothetical protein
MPYKKFSMSDLPPSLLKNKAFDYQQVNNMIINAFKMTDIVRHEVKNKFTTGSKRIYLQTANVDVFKSVQILNRVGSELNYTVTTNTGNYANYIDLERELLDGEELIITFTAKPANNDLLASQNDTVYIDTCVYKTLINNLYNYAKVDKLI